MLVKSFFASTISADYLPFWDQIPGSAITFGFGRHTFAASRGLCTQPLTSLLSNALYIEQMQTNKDEIALEIGTRHKSFNAQTLFQKAFLVLFPKKTKKVVVPP